MNEDGEVRKAKWLFFSLIALLVSCCVSYHELVFFLRGQQAKGAVTKAYETILRGRFGSERGRALTVEYTYTDADGHMRSDSDTVPLDWSLSPDGSVAIQYLPGAEVQSRLAGHVNSGGIVLFVVMCSVVAFFAYRLWHEASEATRPARARGRR
jgi:hypothetical protein